MDHGVEAVEVVTLQIANITRHDVDVAYSLFLGGHERAVVEEPGVEAPHLVARAHQVLGHHRAEVALAPGHEHAFAARHHVTPVSARLPRSSSTTAASGRVSVTRIDGHPAARAACSSRSSSPMNGVRVRSRSCSR